MTVGDSETMKLKYLIKRIKDVKYTDIIAVVPMLLSVAIAPFYKKKYKDTWLISEDKNEARDNGYWFYRKIRENHPEQDCIYAIKKRSVDFNKVSSIGKTVEYGSIMHWILYFTCAYNISSQKGGKPNPALCAFLELNNMYNSHTVFLQHGITKDNARWLYSDVSRLDLFITAAKPEYDYICDNFGYHNNEVVLTGFSRFDNLYNKKAKKNRIVVMPTWRSWFHFNSRKHNGGIYIFEESPYFKCWTAFLENYRLNKMIVDFDLEVVFFPHRNMQRYLDDFKNKVKTNIIIASWKKYDVQELLISSQLMITDYSSVFFDMIYMKKPVLFYQFDYDEFRSNQYEEGYFKYYDNPFGKQFLDVDSLVCELESIIKNNYVVSGDYLKAHSEYFPIYDDNNSERIRTAIINLNNK